MEEGGRNKMTSVSGEQNMKLGWTLLSIGVNLIRIKRKTLKHNYHEEGKGCAFVGSVQIKM